MNNAIIKIKSTLEGTNSRITEAEDRISEVENRMVEITKAEIDVFLDSLAFSIIQQTLAI